MNILELKQRVSDTVNLLTVALSEAEGVEQARLTLEKSTYVATEREKRLNDIEKRQFTEKEEVTAQKKYIDEQVTRNSHLLDGITKERELLVISSKEREDFDKNNAYIEVREKALEEKTLEYQKDRALLKKQEDATKEYQALLDSREKRIKLKEEAINRREQMIGV